MRHFRALALLCVSIILADVRQRAWAENDPAPTTRAMTAPSTQPVQIDPRIAELINDLGNEDAAVRDRAGEGLLAYGPAALVALGRAARCDEPEVRIRAGALLSKVEWALPTDPRSVAAALRQYGERSVDERRRIVRALASYVGPDRRPAWRALGRIMLCDANADVQWEALSQIRIRPNSVMDLGLG
ncbi:MAG TPA: hypothetical protein VFC46_10400, partial [Humisphaera sp.]|nr:hypothetical protein [Humisphaera sp.]